MPVESNCCIRVNIKSTNSNNDLLSQINIILWEVEDYLNKNSLDNELCGNRFTSEQYIAMILGFLDKWILGQSMSTSRSC